MISKTKTYNVLDFLLTVAVLPVTILLISDCTDMLFPVFVTVDYLQVSYIHHIDHSNCL